MDLDTTTVGLLRCPEYDRKTIASDLDRLWNVCGLGTNLRATRVLLKPNLISARMGSLACTEGEFITAVARWFIDRGSRVSIGDSPAFGTAEAVLARIGVISELRRLGARISSFTKVSRQTLPSGLEVGLAADALDCDLLVNLPRVKAHAQLRVTMAVKNYFGCVVGLQKPWWHMAHGGEQGRFASLLAELLSLLPNGMTVVDGIVAMHRTGPMGGAPFPLATIACSANPVAVDRALLDVVGLPLQDSPLLLACRKAGFNGAADDNLRFPLLSPLDLQVQGFVVPEELSPIRFSPFRFLRSSVKRVRLRLSRKA